jgi:hypothetical protein
MTIKLDKAVAAARAAKAAAAAAESKVNEAESKLRAADDAEEASTQLMRKVRQCHDKAVEALKRERDVAVSVAT